MFHFHQLFRLKFAYRQNCECGMKLSCLLHHRSNGAVLFFREANGVFHRSTIHVAVNNVVNSNFRKNLGRVLRLVCFATNFITCDRLTLFPENVDDIKGCASRECDCDQLDRLGSGVAGCIVYKQVMSGSTGGDELASGGVGLSKGYAS